jgi:hypothetical protein
MTKTFSLDDLPATAGLDEVWCHRLVPHITLTDGAKYVADQGNATWLLDAIALAQDELPPATTGEFQICTLRVTPQANAILTGVDGFGRTVFEKAIDYTDFPFAEIVL